MRHVSGMFLMLYHDKGSRCLSRALLVFFLFFFFLSLLPQDASHASQVCFWCFTTTRGSRQTSWALLVFLFIFIFFLYYHETCRRRLGVFIYFPTLPPQGHDKGSRRVSNLRLVFFFFHFFYSTNRYLFTDYLYMIVCYGEGLRKKGRQKGHKWWNIVSSFVP